ncbi:DUF551 domain-containing protein [Klebsiella quasipneumoniae]|uniref:DUF551 domain-containing protein n=2 Tax=Klebsiella quasipneumoniae TaxID=1463165 RepID=UPI0024BC5ACD|nr:DUF551 domain-containing protein [Klebsiella quasipneumoniae]MDJ1030378.1 DUF551 domain-containing protein [Klebsiella quasipneumoniae]
MTKSTITREQLLEIIETDHVQCGEASYLARMALAAMDSEPVAYTDERNLGYIDRGRETAYLWGKQNSEASDVALYRHAQPVPVVPDDVLAAIQKVARIRLDLNDFDGDRRGIADCLYDAEEALIEVVNRRAAMLQAQSDDYGEPTDDERIMAIEGIHNCERCSDGGWVIGEMGITRCACGQADSSPVIPGAEQRIADAVELLQKAAPAMLADNSGSDGPLAGRMKSPVIPDAWIPVSERMPDDDDFVYIWPRPDFGVELHVGQYCECSPKGDGWYAQVYEQNYGIEWHPITVTHWMPLPAGPQGVKGE